MILFSATSLLCLVTFRFRIVNSSHWIVAENGKIQSQLDSVYHLRAPHDLIAFLNQEKRVEKLEEYYAQMLEKVSMINRKRLDLDGVTEVESKLYATDADCLNTDEPLNADDLAFSFFDDGKDLEEFKRLESSPGKTASHLESLPDCSRFSSLEFSLATFPHLQVLTEEWHLEDNQIVEKLPSDIFKYSEIGQILNYELSMNSTSWFHYNLAAIFWRKKGKPNKAIDCAKRAVHFSSRRYKDISLLNLGSLLRYNEYLVEAAIVLHAALDHAPQKPLIHFTLANVYLFLGEFNRSIVFYDNVLHLQPDWRAAQRIRHFVGCNWKHQSNLKLLRDNLHDILHHSHEYQELQMKWLKLHEELLSQVMPLELRLIRQDAVSSFLANKSLLSKTCGYNKRDGELILKCDFIPNKLSSMHEKQLETKIRLQVLANNALSQILKINEKLLHFAIEPPQLNVKASSPQFKNIDELQLPVKSIKTSASEQCKSATGFKDTKTDVSENIGQPSSGNSSPSEKALLTDSDFNDSLKSSVENEDDDGKLELLIDVNDVSGREQNSDAPKIVRPVVQVQPLPYFETGKLLIDEHPRRDHNAFSQVADQRERDENSFSGFKEDVELRQFTRNKVGFENVGTFVGNVDEAFQLKEKISDLIKSIKSNLKRLAANKEALQHSEVTIAFHDDFSNVVTLNKEKFFGLVIDSVEASEILRQEFEFISEVLRSSKTRLSEPNFAEINLASKCSKHFCLSSKETDPVAQELKFSALHDDDQLSVLFKEEINDEDEFLENISQADMSASLLSLLNIPPTVDSSTESGSLECQLGESIIPDLTVDTYTEGKPMTPEPKLLKVLKIAANSDDVSADRIKDYLETILKDSDIWSTATISALFWRYSGDAGKTVVCLQQAVSASPKEYRHSPFMIVSYILLTIGQPNEALLLASLAIQISPHSILSHLTLYKIFSSLGDQKRAQIFRSSSLALLASYEPILTNR
ncbi:unnamed protein product [Bemisia tabaci]|uniref:Tetratricopeptide repeat protein 17 n=2 Tax=Bemisia tabaci TaxID=7038 RepID=A0A9P0A9K4_BEMTA|nr:unnamed protein product [Bemisia tabaci]